MPMFRAAETWFDRDCPSGHIYGINPKYIKLKIMKGFKFMKTPFEMPHNMRAQVCFILLGAQLVSNNPRRQFVLSNVS